MDFFNDIGKKFSSMARSVTEKTREGVESTRLYSDLRSAKNELEQLFCEYGRACYDLRSGAGDAEGAEILAARIEGVMARIQELVEQRDEMRNVRRCPACGSSQSREARFCAHCGQRLPEEALKAEALPESAEEYCPGCGALRENGEKFCQVCGRDLENAPEPEMLKLPGKPALEPVIDAEEPDEESTME